MKCRVKTKRFFAGCLAVVLMCLCVATAPIARASKRIEVGAKVYVFSGKSNYDISSSVPNTSASHIGSLTLFGALKEDGTKNGYPSYAVSDGNVAFTFSFDKSVLDTAKENWHIIEDSAKSVNGISLDDKIKNGAIILQTSLNGAVWVEDVIKTNALTKNANFSGDINGYSTKYIQLQNGCYYRLIVAYEVERKTGEKEHLFGAYSTDITEVKKVAEVYSFYLHDPTTVDNPYAVPSGTQYRLGSTEKVSKDGYSYDKKLTIDPDDPHYGWRLGEFYVTGFTDRAVDKLDGETPVFLKTVGDKVTLWFDLQQDIKKLNNKSNLSISEHNGAYDLTFGTPKTNFRCGTLIIRYTDYQNRTEEPVIYTNFLSANASVFADTKVVLFEEGDYEVSLDYKITDSKGIDTHTYYKIYFKFKVRNGNDMVYPFDSVTGSELKNNDITPNGFRIDLANSKYLKVEVKRFTVSVNSNGLIDLNPSANAVSRDGKTYESEGIYTVAVRSDYTSDPTEKTIYVGSNKYILAMAKYKIDVNALNDKILQGMEVAEDGTIYLPEPEPEHEQDPEPPTSQPQQTGTVEVVGEEKPQPPTDTPSIENTQPAEAMNGEAEDTQDNKVSVMMLIGIGLAVVAAVVVVIVAKRRHLSDTEKNERKEQSV